MLFDIRELHGYGRSLMMMMITGFMRDLVLYHAPIKLISKFYNLLIIIIIFTIASQISPAKPDL